MIRAADAEVVAEPADALHLRALVTAAEQGPDLSVTWVQLAGRHRRLRTDRSTRVYAVLSGVLTVQVRDEEPARAGSGDLVVVPRGTPYDLVGTATYLVINAPAFVPGDDVYLDADEPPTRDGTT